MLTIRFKKEGKKHQKIMRLIVVDSHLATNSGSSKEILG
jgi:ribosomal protein S16